MPERRRIPRRWRIVLWIVGAIAAAVGGIVLAFVLSNPSPSADLALDVPAKTIPESWASPDEPAAEPQVTQATEASSGPTIPYVTTGRLALFGSGKPFGEEVYELRIAEDRTTLSSSGRFWYKVVLATVHVTFEQSFEGDGELRPVSYAAQFHAPLGFDRAIRATVEEDRLTVERAGDTEEVRIDPERTFTLGTFSTYVLLPRLFALRQNAGSASFEVLVFGGPPNQETSADAAEGDLPLMTIARAGSASLRAGERVLEVDRYVVLSGFGETELFARGEEFLALRAGSEDESLWVYRSDFFSSGVEVLDAAP